jgi:hypothetical protein
VIGAHPYKRVQLSTGNVGMVAKWLLDHGAGMLGLSWQDSGDIQQRGLYFGTLGGGIIHAPVGDWIVLDTRTGDFDTYDAPPSWESPSTSYEWGEAPAIPTERPWSPA